MPLRKAHKTPPFHLHRRMLRTNPHVGGAKLLLHVEGSVCERVASGTSHRGEVPDSQNLEHTVHSISHYINFNVLYSILLPSSSIDNISLHFTQLPRSVGSFVAPS